MTERPILFAAPLVRAILAGTKTQTRRAGGLAAVNEHPDDCEFYELLPDWRARFRGRGPMRGRWLVVRCPYGGDRLWVRETWYCDHCFAGDYAATRKSYVGREPLTDEECIAEWKGNGGDLLYYRADGEACDQFEQLDPPGARIWKPSIHMPRWASRITLAVEAVRVERLHDITEEDARAEGIGEVYRTPGEEPAWTERDGFARRWSERNGRASWDANPWVWVVEFRRVVP